MKTKIFLILTVLATILAGGCKTNENNYREAYLKARERATDTGDSTTTADLRSSLEPKMLKIGEVELPVITQHVAMSKEAGNPEGISMQRYGVVVGKFRQIFNAKSMRERLAANGYPEALVVYNGSQEYFVVACSTSVPAEASALLDKVRADSSLTLREPYPYILRPAMYVR